MDGTYDGGPDDASDIDDVIASINFPPLFDFASLMKKECNGTEAEEGDEMDEGDEEQPPLDGEFHLVYPNSSCLPLLILFTLAHLVYPSSSCLP